LFIFVLLTNKKMRMKKVVTLFSLLLIFSAFTFANTDSYRIDDNQIESLFAAAEEVTFSDMSLSDGLQEFQMASPTQVKGEPTPVVGWVLCFFLGGLGIHRLYLGTATLTFIGYLCTGGGFGILALGDCVVLLIGVLNDDISKYVDNPALIMW
jgi:TM2 domain-containing membrane protein YozV